MCHVVFLKERNAQSFEGCEKLVLVLKIVMLKTSYDWMVVTVPYLIKIVMEVEGQNHVYFNHMTYLISHMTSLNKTCRWSYKLSRNDL